MKRLLIYFLLLLVPVTLCAQRCYSTKSTNGTKLFKQGKYSEARALFVEAKSCPDKPKNGNENMDFWIKQCDEVLKTQKSSTTNNTYTNQSPSQPKNSTTTNNNQTQTTETYLSVLPSDLTFNSWGDSKTVDVYCNAEWEVSVTTASWVHLTRNGNKISLKVDANRLVTERTDYFVLKSGSKTCRVNIKQNGVTPYISATSTSLHYKTEGGTQTIHITSNCEWKVLVSPAYWVKLTRSGNDIYLNALPNTSGNSRSDYFTLTAGGQNLRINITQEYVKPRGFFVEEEKFATNFLNFHGAYNLKNEEPFLGMSYSFIKSHLGFRLSGYVGMGELGNSYIATFNPLFRMTNDNSALDLQLYLGGGVYNGSLIGDAGLRFAWRSKRNFSLWDFSLGCMGTLEGDIIPNLGLGVAIPFSPVIGLYSLISNSSGFYDFSKHFVDINIIINSNWGISYSYVPQRAGWYVTTLFDDDAGVLTGPVLRIVSSSSEVDLQLYGGVGYYNGFAYDFGIRIAPTPNRSFSWWDCSVGVTGINGQEYFTIGGSLGISAIIGSIALMSRAYSY